MTLAHAKKIVADDWQGLKFDTLDMAAYEIERALRFYYFPPYDQLTDAYVTIMKASIAALKAQDAATNGKTSGRMTEYLVRKRLSPIDNGRKPFYNAIEEQGD